MYGGSELLSGSSSVALLNAEASDLAAYDEVARSLEMSQRRRIGLQQDLETLQREMRQVEADIVEKSANGLILRSYGFLDVIGRCASKNDPQSFDFQLSTTFGRGVKVVHTIFGHDFWLIITFTICVLARRHMCPG